MTIKEKVKSWVKDHPEELIVATGSIAVIGLFVAIIIAADKDQRKAIDDYNNWANDMNQWLNDEHNKGNVIYALDDGRYLTVAADAKQETFLK